jgi:hypothetical protein
VFVHYKRERRVLRRDGEREKDDVSQAFTEVYTFSVCMQLLGELRMALCKINTTDFLSSPHCNSHLEKQPHTHTHKHTLTHIHIHIHTAFPGRGSPFFLFI